MIRSLLLILSFTGIMAFPAVPANFETTLLSVSPPPMSQNKYIWPYLDAKAILVMDKNSSTILYEKNGDDRLPMASLTKIMTAVIILEENDLNEVSIVNTDFKNLEGNKIDLELKEKITVKNLLFGALIASGNDAALLLAIHNAGDVPKFVEKMNNKARDLGLTNTHFMNPIGYDDARHYSSARDLAFLTLYALKKPFFRKAVAINELTISSINGFISHKLTNTNQLLNSYLNIKGVKTGTTDEAGQCLITLLETEDHKEILSVVLNSQIRFDETKILLDYIIRNYKW